MAAFAVAAEVADAEALLAAIEEHRPDLAVVDVRTPPGFTDEGVRAALAMRRQWPKRTVVPPSQYVEQRYVADVLTTDTSGVGYLLKQRVADVEEFGAAVQRGAAGSTALSDPLERLAPREREVLTLMAEGRSNAGIAESLVVSDSAAAKHINNIIAKLDLPTADSDHRRVLAVLGFLGASRNRRRTQGGRNEGCRRGPSRFLCRSGTFDHR
ncbi:LuxR C-terminal-related transcriptional regulator [Streptomyces sp. RB6PN25]|uniref:LuxR C-terminal-related transcriptional regulator n=1 Tax=Streptomyces humicola TaxID=2953240 RepID=A0ABT1PUF0_9ACTN|nr:LuxR C-terminal-related transcriptional regulator [Streptomyces humicola]MCQ4081301.1 LuxR C-terminal-related transcriptional regulator [Streptomyces humicola]